jgi:hypothetical protein
MCALQGRSEEYVIFVDTETERAQLTSLPVQYSVTDRRELLKRRHM